MRTYSRMFSISLVMACSAGATAAWGGEPAKAPAEPAKEKAGPEAVVGPKVGDRAELFILNVMNKELAKMKNFPLRSFVGADAKEKKQSVVLSFAASYCEPCKRELAELKELAGALSAKDVLLAVVVVDTEKDGIEAMRALTIDKLALPYPVLSDRFGMVARRYKANTLPMTVIIDPNGIVKWVSSGFAPDAIEKLRAQLSI